MSTPSGFCDGTSMMIVFARIACASGVVAARQPVGEDERRE